MKTPDDEERASQEIGHGGIRDLREAGFEVIPAARLREREAQAAAIRGSLVEWLVLHEEALRSREDAIRIYNSGQLPTVVQKCKEALTSPDPGQPLLDRLQALEEALKPFAAFYAAWEANNYPQHVEADIDKSAIAIQYFDAAGEFFNVRVTYADFRGARAVLQQAIRSGPMNGAQEGGDEA